MTPGHNRLAALAGEIAEHHAAAGAATREVIRHAIAACRALTEAKAIVGHGQWLPWLKANVPGISARTAQRYLATAHHAGENDTVSHFRLRDLARRPRPSLDDRIGQVMDGLTRYGEMIAAATTPETFREAQDFGLRIHDELGDIIRETERVIAIRETERVIARLAAEIAAELP